MRAGVYWRSLVQGLSMTTGFFSSVMGRCPSVQMGEGALEWSRKRIRELQSVGALENAGREQPVLELGGRLQAEGFAHIERVVERGRLVVQHDVVGPGDAHDERDARDREQREQRVHVVLIGFRVVRVADVAPHRYAEQLAAEVILEARADDLLSVVEIFGP